MSTSTIPQGRNLSTPRASEPPLEHTARGPTDQGRAAAHEESIWVAGIRATSLPNLVAPRGQPELAFRLMFDVDALLPLTLQ